MKFYGSRLTDPIPDPIWIVVARRWKSHHFAVAFDNEGSVRRSLAANWPSYPDRDGDFTYDMFPQAYKLENGTWVNVTGDVYTPKGDRPKYVAPPPPPRGIPPFPS